MGLTAWDGELDASGWVPIIGRLSPPRSVDPRAAMASASSSSYHSAASSGARVKSNPPISRALTPPSDMVSQHIIPVPSLSPPVALSCGAGAGGTGDRSRVSGSTPTSTLNRSRAWALSPRKMAGALFDLLEGLYLLMKGAGFSASSSYASGPTSRTWKECKSLKLLLTSRDLTLSPPPSAAAVGDGGQCRIDPARETFGTTE
eukprot:313922-Prorocentrum_minimum.AAC.1